MAVSLVQSDGKHVQTVNNTTLAYPSNVTAGNLLVGVMCHFNTAGVAISVPTDTLSHTWVAWATTLGISFNIRLRGFYAENCTGGANTVTFDSAGTTNGDITCAVAEFSGLLTDADDGAGVQGTSTSSTPTSGNKTPSVNDALLVGVATHAGGNISFAEEGGWNLIYEFEDGTAGMPISFVWKQQSGSPAAEDADWTLGSSQLWGAAIMAFKPSAVAPKSLVIPRYRNALIVR